MATEEQEDQVHCAGGCSKTAKDEEAAEKLGWDYLPITSRWRCGQCGRELRAVNEYTGGL